MLLDFDFELFRVNSQGKAPVSKRRRGYDKSSVPSSRVGSSLCSRRRSATNQFVIANGVSSSLSPEHYFYRSLLDSDEELHRDEDRLPKVQVQAHSRLPDHRFPREWHKSPSSGTKALRLLPGGFQTFTVISCLISTVGLTCWNIVEPAISTGYIFSIVFV